MAIQIIQGMPGSGKTASIIELVNRMRAAGERVFLFVRIDAPEFVDSAPLHDHRSIASRSGTSCSVDFAETIAGTKAALIDLLNQSPATLVFEEAQYFGLELADHWGQLASKGFRIVLSTPTERQVAALPEDRKEVINLKMACGLLGDGEASTFFILPGSDTTLSVCASCSETILARARISLAQQLIKNEPHPGEKRIYQAIDLPYPEFQELAPVRSDCFARLDIMRRHVREEIGHFDHRAKTYADIGCNTGFFCKGMADLGFLSAGIDVVKEDIAVGQLLDRFFYRRYVRFIEADAVHFIEANNISYDVVSTFSVFQWIYIQHDKARVDAALLKLFREASKLVFFEMGYTEEKHYKGRLQFPIDRDWCLNTMRDSGLFRHIVDYPEGYKGLKRDFFVGVRN